MHSSPLNKVVFHASPALEGCLLFDFDEWDLRRMACAYAPVMGLASPYRSSGADLPFGRLTAAHGVAMEGLLLAIH